MNKPDEELRIAVEERWAGMSLHQRWQCAERLLSRAESAQAEVERLREALKVLRNPDPTEYEANAYVRRMATFARDALEPSAS